jgi:hypothetical protein
MADLDLTSEGGTGLSRRTLIKGGAMVGGLVWAAPVIDSFTSPASATSGAPFACSYALVVFSLGGTTYAVKFGQNAISCSDTNTDGDYKNSVVGVCGNTTYAIDANNNITQSVSGGAATEIPPYGGDCGQLFTINPGGCSVTGNTVAAGTPTILFVLVHDGSFGKTPGGPEAGGGTLQLGTSMCGSGSSFTITGGCGC